MIHPLSSRFNSLLSVGLKPWRNFSIFSRLLQTPAVESSHKKLVASLRRRTGFPIKQCSEALRLHGSDEEVAVKWLNEQAEKEGWTKAKKVSGRTASQGLCSVLVRDNFVAFVELACETDFVARNELFQRLLTTATYTALAFRQNVIKQNLALSSLNPSRVSHERETMLTYKLLKLPAVMGTGGTCNDTTEANPGACDGSLEDHIVATIGRLGENILVKRAMAVVTPVEYSIHAAMHGGITGESSGCLFGAYTAAVFLKPTYSDIGSADELEVLGRRLSHHVIGMNPLSIHGDDDSALMNQEFLMDQSRTIAEVVSEAKVEVVDFVRFGLNE